MTRVVWKYPLESIATELFVPAPAKIVGVGPTVVSPSLAHELPAVWIQHPKPTDVTERVTLRLAVFGTGHDVPDEAHHVGSAWCGPFMWHVYELDR